MGDADVVALGFGRSGGGVGWAVEMAEHSLDHASVNRADDRMFHHRIAEGAVLGDDLVLVVLGAFSSGCKPVS